MKHFSRSWSVLTTLFAVFAFMVLPAAAQEPQPPFFGPPGNPNTEPGLVDVNGTETPAYPRRGDWGDNSIYLQSPWSDCEAGSWSFNVQAIATGAILGKYDRFDSMGRTFTIDQQDADGNYIGGTLDVPWSTSGGTLTLVKSDPSLATYDQVHLVGTKSVGGGSQSVNVHLPLVEQDGYIGVANLASLGVIKPCGQANANSQIMLPLGTGANGQPTIIPDIDGDGVADPEFLPGPPLSGSDVPPIPTLTEWGLIVMTLLLLIVGLRFLRSNTASPASA